MAFRKMVAVAGKALKWGAGALGGVVALLLAINSADENPSPQVRAWLASPQTKADSSNGFPALVGSVTAPAAEDFVGYGKRWVDSYNAARNSAAIAAANAHFSGDGIQFVGDEKLLCNPLKAPCLAQARERAVDWRKLAADNEMLLARQRRLTEFTFFEQSYFPPSFESPFPAYSASAARQLQLDLIALDTTEGRTEPALAALEARLAFDRRALTGSGDMLMAMLSSSWLRQDYALLAEIVAARPKALAAQKARLLRMTEPLQTEQVRAVASRMFEGEFRYISRNLSLVNSTPALRADANISLLERPFFKVHATQNLHARQHAELQAQIREFVPAQAESWQARLHAQRANDGALKSWRRLYNPTGKRLADMMEVNYGAYVLKLSDLMGVMRLARLQVEAVSNGKTAANLPAYIAADKALFDPYTDRPMGWDEGKRQLYFDVRGNVPGGASKRVVAGI